jgi:hypothetical protein
MPGIPDAFTKPPESFRYGESWILNEFCLWPVRGQPIEEQFGASTSHQNLVELAPVIPELRGYGIKYL